MAVKQISVFLENKQGRLLAVTKNLQERRVNIRALSVADTADFGILRMIVDKPNEAYQGLKQGGFTVSFTEVIVVEMEDVPGGLGKVLAVLSEAAANVEYVYAFCNSDTGGAINVLRLDKQEEGIKALTAAGIRVLTDGEIFNI